MLEDAVEELFIFQELFGGHGGSAGADAKVTSMMMILLVLDVTKLQ